MCDHIESGIKKETCTVLTPKYLNTVQGELLQLILNAGLDPAE